jgi:hypothetical protein
MWHTQKVLLYQPLQKINTLLFTYDQVIGDSEDNFQREIFTTAKHSKRFWDGNITIII